MTPRHEFEILERGQCLELLQTARVGRVIFTEHALPAVQPVNCQLCHGNIVIRFDSEAKLAAVAGNRVVAFETDELDPDLRTGWSVTVVGHAQLITDISDLVELSRLFLQPYVESRQDYFVRIRTEKVTGSILRAPDLNLSQVIS